MIFTRQQFGELGSRERRELFNADECDGLVEVAGRTFFDEVVVDFAR